ASGLPANATDYAQWQRHTGSPGSSDLCVVVRGDAGITLNPGVSRRHVGQSVASLHILGAELAVLLRSASGRRAAAVPARGVFALNCHGPELGTARGNA